MWHILLHRFFGGLRTEYGVVGVLGEVRHLRVGARHEVGFVPFRDQLIVGFKRLVFTGEDELLRL